MTQPALFAKELPAIEFSVAGAPVPQGSKSAFVQGGRAVVVDVANRKTKTMPANRLKDWRAVIAAKAAGLMVDEELWTGPVMLECVFVIARAPSHFTKKGAFVKGAPMFPQGDLDKLIRAVGDALSKVVYRDDVQIVSFGGSTKRFAKTREAVGGVYVRVRQL